MCVNIPLNSWYNHRSMLERSEWFQLCTREVVDSHHPGVRCTTANFKCGCGRSFHRQGDLTRHLNFCDSQPTVAQNTFRMFLWTDFPSSKRSYGVADLGGWLGGL